MDSKKIKRNEIIKLELPEDTNISVSKAEQITKVFEPMAIMLADFEDAYNALIEDSKKGVTDDIISKAKRLRIDISRIRIDAEKVRKAEKEEYVRAGRAIDGVNNILKWAIIDKEEALKYIETTRERKEAERLEALEVERVKKIQPYLSNAENYALSLMKDDVFEAFYEMKKKECEDRLLVIQDRKSVV